ncbi:MAG: hypothetical protein LBE59_11715 [Nevskiaceae bacterium]|jgi:predicted metalloprotease with PDZ domain|nr:hypothetical protein [Nevskiaceae bacterium]
MSQSMTVDVDLTDTERRIFRVALVIPVRSGKVSLYYPQWLPGNHGPRGTLDQVTALRFSAGGQNIPWRRDPVDVFRFDLVVPEGVQELQAQFVLATPQQAGTGQNSRVVASPQMLNLQWNQVVLYPADCDVSQMPISASVRLPKGWTQAGALRAESLGGEPASDFEHLRFETASLETLIDSPLFAAPVYASYDLTPEGSAPVHLHVFGDDAADVRASDAQIQLHRRMVRELLAIFGAPRYDHYEMLLHLSESISGIGLEHLRSAENSHSPAYFREWDSGVYTRDLLAHEMCHSWNGKYRRPARLWTPNYNTPMQGDLLWVYEGMTQFYGIIVTARAGLWTQEFARDELAMIAAMLDRKRAGRVWRSLEDTTAQPVITARRPLSWVSSQRTEDYYMESVLLWLDVDTKLREMTGGQRCLDDFSRLFLDAPATHGMSAVYEFDDVANALNAVAPFDWGSFLRERVTGTQQPLMQGIERAGYRLVYDDKPNLVTRDVEKIMRSADLSYSLGIVMSRDHVLTEVVWDSPAFDAGLTVNTALVAVNGRAINAEVLKNAVTRAKGDGKPIELLVKNGDRYRTVSIDYREGLQYPHLVLTPGSVDGLAAVLASRASS